MNLYGALTELISFTGSLLLLCYWLARTWLLIRHSDEVLNRVLTSDLCLGRRIWLSVRMMFAPPQTYWL